MNILFLDIDGVLNHEKHYEDLDYINNRELIISMDRFQRHINKESLKVLNRICNDFSFYIVISSTWRMLYSIDELQEEFNNIGGKFTIIGKTGRCCSGIKGVEINNYLNQNREKDIFNYVILDDDSDMLLWQKIILLK